MIGLEKPRILENIFLMVDVMSYVMSDVWCHVIWVSCSIFSMIRKGREKIASELWVWLRGVTVTLSHNCVPPDTRSAGKDSSSSRCCRLFLPFLYFIISKLKRWLTLKPSMKYSSSVLKDKNEMQPLLIPMNVQKFEKIMNMARE